MVVGLKDLTGEHVLDAVDFDTIPAPNGDTANRMRFRLDGIIYEAIEDPSDGYRSCLSALLIGDGSMVNVFPPCSVFGRHVDSREAYSCMEAQDFVELVDATTGKVVLAVGTTDIDDYYPGYIATFDPAAMAVNAGVKHG